MDKNQGYVYILTNPSFKEDWVKIGKSSRPVNVRIKELDNTAVPLPFEIYATLKTSKYNAVEKQIHRQIDLLTDLRIRQSREFFNVKPQVALEFLKDIANLLDDAEIEEVFLQKKYSTDEENEECKSETSKEKGKRRPGFKFSMVNIQIGETLIFTPAKLEVKVASDDKIEYQDRLYRLSTFVGTFMPDKMRNTSGSYQGATFFTYNGKVLDEIRTEIENA